MSTASRQLPPASSTSPASVPVLLIGSRLDRVKLRAELRYMVQSCGWSHRDALVRLMQKARLQLGWARKEAADRAAAQQHAAAQIAATEAQAQALAAKHGHDVSVLTSQLSRWQFGSLSLTHRAPHERAVHRRAVAIACEVAQRANELAA